MRGVIGALLVLLGIEICYLVLAGKLPLHLKPKDTSGGASTTTASPLDTRGLAVYRVPTTSTQAIGYPSAFWKGLMN